MAKQITKHLMYCHKQASLQTIDQQALCPFIDQAALYSICCVRPRYEYWRR